MLLGITQLDPVRHQAGVGFESGRAGHAQFEIELPGYIWTLQPGRDECVVGNLLRRWAGERPGTHFLEFEDGSAWTFADTLERVRHAAAGLRSLGVQQGSHVLCWMPNSAAAVLSWLAATYLGAVHVPINTGYRGLCTSIDHR